MEQMQLRMSILYLLTYTFNLRVVKKDKSIKEKNEINRN